MHFYDAKAPVAKGTFMPGYFPVSDYQALQKRLGLERVIVVQANAYADDNSVTLNSIRMLGKGAKGVAVVKPGVAEAELERLTKGGICAVRIMTLHGGLLGFDVMDQVMARVHPFGW
ncbi:MAG TPA: amidohydrolase family protein, partial [Opitutaceae bacterium]